MLYTIRKNSDQTQTTVLLRTGFMAKKVHLHKRAKQKCTEVSTPLKKSTGKGCWYKSAQDKRAQDKWAQTKECRSKGRRSKEYRTDERWIKV